MMVCNCYVSVHHACLLYYVAEGVCYNVCLSLCSMLIITGFLGDMFVAWHALKYVCLVCCCCCVLYTPGVVCCIIMFCRVFNSDFREGGRIARDSAGTI